MLEFSKLTLDDIDTITPFLNYSKNMICDNTIGGAFMWRDFFGVEYALFNGTVIFKARVKYHNNVVAFSPPLGGDIMGSSKEITKYSSYHNLPLVYFHATGYDLEVLREIYGDYKSCYYEDWSDYIYTASDITSLAGRKFSGQRNHINFFKKTYTDYAFEVVTKDNIQEVYEFFRQLHENFNKTSEILSEEYVKTIEVFDKYDVYNLLGGLLRVNNSIVAFSLAEILNDVLFVHIEKADIRYRGAYQVINNEFAKHFCTDNVRFVNRAEDNGDEGLRTAKKAYHPCGIINKYIVEIES
jgi:hypothetical protein